MYYFTGIKGNTKSLKLAALKIPYACLETATTIRD